MCQESAWQRQTGIKLARRTALESVLYSPRLPLPTIPMLPKPPNFEAPLLPEFNLEDLPKLPELPNLELSLPDPPNLTPDQMALLQAIISNQPEPTKAELIEYELQMKISYYQSLVDQFARE